jgi:hypothetical protein
MSMTRSFQATAARVGDSAHASLVEPHRRELQVLGGAVAVSEALAGPVATELLEAGRKSFTQGMQVASLTVPAATAVLAAVILRGVRAGSEPEDAGAPGPVAVILEES